MKYILVILLLMISHHLYSQTIGVEVVEYTFEEIEELQKQKQKPIVVFIHTSWCKFCYAMREKTFANLEVTRLLNEYFYFVSLDAELKRPVRYMKHLFEYKKQTSSSGIHELAEVLASTDKGLTYPTTVLLGENNIIDEQIDSYMSAKQFLWVLKRYLEVK
ncbi:MAG TPA: hypothetical protein DDY16_07450 [Tenacibaculum sp.]|nr:hypothetical protein [Tenacibaculum sp.]